MTSAHADLPIDSVLLIAFGGPEKPEDIRPFLDLVTAGRRIPRERFEDVAHHYELIGGHSPLNELTRRQAEGLREALGRAGLDDLRLQAQFTSGALGLPKLGCHVRIVGIAQDADALDAGLSANLRESFGALIRP